MKAILTYHAIDEARSPISLSPHTFAAHVAWLTSGRVAVLPLDDLLRRQDDDTDAVAVTFDDGFRSQGDALARLLDAGIPATLFVVSAHVGGTNAWGGRSAPGIPTLPLLDWSELGHLVARGAAIGAHTRTHPCLPALPHTAIDEEVGGCLDDIEARLGVRSAHFAYPYGAFDDRVASCVAPHVAWAYTTDFDVLERSDEPDRLPRLDMYYFRAPGALEAWGSPAFARRVAWVRARRALRALSGRTSSG